MSPRGILAPHIAAATCTVTVSRRNSGILVSQSVSALVPGAEFQKSKELNSAAKMLRRKKKKRLWSRKKAAIKNLKYLE
jgi:hypothetical protein